MSECTIDIRHRRERGRQGGFSSRGEGDKVTTDDQRCKLELVDKTAEPIWGCIEKSGPLEAVGIEKGRPEVPPLFLCAHEMQAEHAGASRPSFETSLRLSSG